MLKKIIMIYPGESFYSYIARLYAQSGLLWNTAIAKEILAKPNEYVNHNYINSLKEEFRNQLEAYISLEEVLMNHTLFKYYARFLPKEKRIKAYEVALRNKKNLSFMYLPIPVNRRNYFLRYCPICVEEDRKKYGECYFHIEHQIPEIHCCSIHMIRLVDTEIRNSDSYDSTFIPLEIAIKQFNKIPATKIEAEVAEYIRLVQMEDLNIDSDSEIGNFLSSKLSSKYFSPRGQRKFLNPLLNDLQVYYKDLTEFDLNRQRVMTILNDDYINVFDIYLLALFEKISPKELSLQVNTNKKRWETFDDKIKKLKEKGLSNIRISRIMKVNKEVVRQVVLGKYYKK